MKARIVRLIETMEPRGIGTDSDPVRIIRQLWTLSGEFVAEVDPVNPDKDRVTFEYITDRERDAR